MFPFPCSDKIRSEVHPSRPCFRIIEFWHNGQIRKVFLKSHSSPFFPFSLSGDPAGPSVSSPSLDDRIRMKSYPVKGGSSSTLCLLLEQTIGILLGDGFLGQGSVSRDDSPGSVEFSHLVDLRLETSLLRCRKGLVLGVVADLSPVSEVREVDGEHGRELLVAGPWIDKITRELHLSRVTSPRRYLLGLPRLWLRSTGSRRQHIAAVPGGHPWFRGCR